MQKSNRLPIKSSEIISFSYALVVLTSFFSGFAGGFNARPMTISGIILLGIAYIALGSYGYNKLVHEAPRLVRVIYFITQLLLASAISAILPPMTTVWLVFLPLIAQSILLFSAGWMVLANIFILLTQTGVTIWISQAGQAASWSNSILNFLAGQLFVLIFIQTMVDEENLRRRTEQIASELASANEQLQKYANEIEEMTLTKERNRLAREIHDGLGHALTTIHMQIQAADALLDKNPAKARESLDSARVLVKDTLDDIRNSVFALKSATELSFYDQIKKLVDYARSGKMKASMKKAGAVRELGPKVEYILYRIAQEGINNVLKHAQATRMLVEFDYSDPKKFFMKISDNGVGVAHMKEGFGMKSMKERAQMIHGKVSIGSEKDSGTLLTIEVPL